MQGGPHNQQAAAIAIALREAQGKLFKKYGQAVVKNAKALASELINLGFEIISGGTDNHLMLIDLRNKGISGKEAAIVLEKAGIVVNYNSIPFDPNPPMNPSGIRIGTPAVTTRGMGKAEMRKIAGWMDEVLSSQYSVSSVRRQVKELCRIFPIPL